jgi:hypothetical protein
VPSELRVNRVKGRGCTEWHEKTEKNEIKSKDFPEDDDEEDDSKEEEEHDDNY